MKALITGASSGIGYEMAKYLASKDIDLILVARRKSRLDKMKKEFKNVDVKVIPLDISIYDNLELLYNSVKDDDVDILINNAGFGLFGDFDETDLETEFNMIDLNIKALHYLTKKFLVDFKEKDSGYILNVASSAGFTAGPRLSTYYATKNYVLRLTEAIYEELRRDGSNVHVSALCPGPVETEFNSVAHGEFASKGVSAEYVAKYAIDRMFKNKLLIVPTFKIKAGIFIQRFLPIKLVMKFIYKFQSGKMDKKDV
jgi:short-subunit dehydrogenase